jgi:hypothetical protein
MKMSQAVRKYQWFSDKGHGWMRVPLQDLRELNFTDKVAKAGDGPTATKMSADSAYLEEDADAGAFLDAAKAAGWTVTQNLNVVQFDKCPLRDFSAYNADFAKNPIRPERRVSLVNGGDARVIRVERAEGGRDGHQVYKTTRGQNFVLPNIVVETVGASREQRVLSVANFTAEIQESRLLKAALEASRRNRNQPEAPKPNKPKF